MAEEEVAVSSRFLRLIFLGFALVSVGIIIIAIVAALSGSGSVGGVILIGPIPIVFGAGPDAAWLIAVGAALTIISLIVFLVLNRRICRMEA